MPHRSAAILGTEDLRIPFTEIRANRNSLRSNRRFADLISLFKESERSLAVSAEAASPILVFVMYIVNESEVSVVCIIE